MKNLIILLVLILKVNFKLFVTWIKISSHNIHCLYKRIPPYDFSNQFTSIENIENKGWNEILIYKLTQIVQDNFTNEQFGVKELVKIYGMSRSQLHRKLKPIKGQSISQFIREIRLEKAMQLLQKNETTVSEIAYQVGFNSPTYFNTCFHDYFGYPPGEVKFRFPQHDLQQSPKLKIVKHHNNMIQKLGVSGKNELLRYALERCAL